ncbi:MAG: glycoside hydrolase family 16 protein [Pseudomonadota bacterium]
MNRKTFALGVFCFAVFFGTVGSSAANGWTTVWVDDFDGSSLDLTKWTPEQSCWGGGNDERQCYTDRPVNVSVEDGVLRLQAKKERFTGPLYPRGTPRDRGAKRTQNYTSGKVHTVDKATWTYGRFSARLKLPEGQGTWPAFWMMPSTSVYGAWPLSGEIDIMEAVNLKTPCEDCSGGFENRTIAALHFGDLVPKNTYLTAKHNSLGDVSPADEWRVYSVEWAEDLIQWFVDGDIVLQLSADSWFTASKAADGRPHAPFDQPFHLILNLAVGGNLSEKSNQRGFSQDSFPTELLVDWVRVDQCNEDIETGRACMTDIQWSGTPETPWEVQAR